MPISARIPSRAVYAADAAAGMQQAQVQAIHDRVVAFFEKRKPKFIGR